MQHATFDTLVLSGEGIDGIITLGCLQFLYDKKLLNNINTYIGTSSGTMCGFLLSIGYTPIEIVMYLHENSIFDSVFNFSLFALFKQSGLFDFSNIYNCLEEMTVLKLGYVPTLLELYNKHNKKLITTTYNFTKKKTEYIDYISYPNLSCLMAIQMSSSIPILFSNCVYNNDIYIDGAVTNNFPINLVKPYQKALSIYIDITDKKNNSTNISFIHKFLNCLRHFITINTNLRISGANNNIKKNMYRIRHNNKLCFKNYDKLTSFAIGYNQAKEIYSTKIDEIENTDV